MWLFLLWLILMWLIVLGFDLVNVDMIRSGFSPLTWKAALQAQTGVAPPWGEWDTPTDVWVKGGMGEQSQRDSWVIIGPTCRNQKDRDRKVRLRVWEWSGSRRGREQHRDREWVTLIQGFHSFSLCFYTFLSLYSAFLKLLSSVACLFFLYPPDMMMRLTRCFPVCCKKPDDFWKQWTISMINLS